MSFVVPAVLPTSRKDLEEKLMLFAKIPSVSRVQIDVVDGKFASPASWPFFAEATKGKPHSELEVMVKNGEMLPYLDRFEYEIDLMCLDAERVAGDWLALGATRLTFHAEAATDIGRLLAGARKSYGTGDGFAPGLVSFGLASNLASNLTLIEPYLGDIDYVQYMGIAKVGRQGQPFDEHVFEKIRTFHSRHPDIAVQVDGGVSLANAKKLIALGVSNLVIGSGILKASNPGAEVAKFESLESPFGV